jgi:plasmid stability protein
MYGVHRTTVYLPDELKRALARVAAARGCSEAELVRQALAALAASAEAPEPRLPLFESGDPTLAERLDEALRGFGER